MLQGVGVCRGIVREKAVRFEQATIVIPEEGVQDSAAEIRRFREAIEQVKENSMQLRAEAEEKIGEEEAAIFAAHQMLLEDEESLLEPIEQLIQSDGLNAVKAVDLQFDEVAAIMESIDDEYMQQRAADIRDLKSQVQRVLLGIKTVDIGKLSENAVLVARDLAPSDTIRLDLRHIRGIICEEGGATSHTAILANAMGIAAIVSCKGIMEQVSQNDMILMDGETGQVIINPSEKEQQAFKERADLLEKENLLVQKYRGVATVTLDGRELHVEANIAKPEECAPAVEADCEGVGLFRSEFLYMDENSLPTEEMQYLAYKEALEAAKGRPVTIRTLDVGGDKGLAGLTIPNEENPFLGYRAIRICLDDRSLFKTQLRALYRAGVHGNLKIMFPMISTLEELLEAKAVASQVREELRADNIPFCETVPLGMMMEVPAAAVMADVFAREADFFSIGTNDLTQYTMAVDRGNGKVAHLYSHYQPAVVRLIASIIRAAHEAGIPCCMCGEAAGDMSFIPFLIGAGLDDFSMAPGNLLRARKLICESSAAECEKLAAKILAAGTRQEVYELLRG